MVLNVIILAVLVVTILMLFEAGLCAEAAEETVVTSAPWASEQLYSEVRAG